MVCSSENLITVGNRICQEMSDGRSLDFSPAFMIIFGVAIKREASWD